MHSFINMEAKSRLERPLGFRARVISQKPENTWDERYRRSCSVLFPIENREGADTQELGGLLLCELTQEATTLDVLSEGLGSFGKRLGFLSFQPDRHVWQKGNASLHVRLLWRPLRALPLHTQQSESISRTHFRSLARSH